MPQTERVPEPSPEPLSDHYHSARKQLVLWSAILLAWESIGIDPSKLKGSAEGFADSIKNPTALPSVIGVVVLYFLIRVTIEWYQCDPRRRDQTASRVDRYLSIVIAALALLALAFGYRGAFISWARGFANYAPIAARIALSALAALLAAASSAYLRTQLARVTRKIERDAARERRARRAASLDEAIADAQRRLERVKTMGPPYEPSTVDEYLSGLRKARENVEREGEEG